MFLRVFIHWPLTKLLFCVRFVFVTLSNYNETDPSGVVGWENEMSYDSKG